VEHHVLHAGLHRPLGDQFADGGRRRGVRSALELAPQLLVQRRSSSESTALPVVDHLSIDILGRTMDRKARAIASNRLELAANAPRAAFDRNLADHCWGPYFFLPSLRMIVSSAYFTPLPL